MTNNHVSVEQIHDFLMDEKKGDVVSTIEALIKMGVPPRLILEGVGAGVKPNGLPYESNTHLQLAIEEGAAILVANEGVSISRIVEQVKQAAHDRVLPNVLKRREWHLSDKVEFAEYEDGLYLLHPTGKGDVVPFLMAYRSNGDHLTKTFLILEYLLESPEKNASKAELMDLLNDVNQVGNFTIAEVTTAISELNNSLHAFPVEVAVDGKGQAAVVTLKPKAIVS